MDKLQQSKQTLKATHTKALNQQKRRYKTDIQKLTNQMKGKK